MHDAVLDDRSPRPVACSADVAIALAPTAADRAVPRVMSRCLLVAGPLITPVVAVLVHDTFSGTIGTFSQSGGLVPAAALAACVLAELLTPQRRSR